MNAPNNLSTSQSYSKSVRLHIFMNYMYERDLVISELSLRISR